MAKSWLNRSFKAVVIGGSTGSIDVLLNVLPSLTSPLPYALIIVLHRKNTADSTLVDLFALKTTIPLQEVDDKDPVLPGVIYLAPADYHLLVEKTERFALDDSEKVNYSRPSIDVTFESAADVYGDSLVGILLSGANADGTQGLLAIKKGGGLLIAQKPETAQVAFMPQQAIQHTPIDFILDIKEITAFLTSLNRSPVR